KWCTLDCVSYKRTVDWFSFFVLQCLPHSLLASSFLSCLSSSMSAFPVLAHLSPRLLVHASHPSLFSPCSGASWMRPCGANACLLKEEVWMRAMMCCGSEKREASSLPWLSHREPGE